jgi:hypothetical protein
MKRMILTVAAIFTLAACGGLNEAPATDSTLVNDPVALAVDTVDVVTDSAQLNDAVGGSSSAHEIPVK